MLYQHQQARSLKYFIRRWVAVALYIYSSGQIVQRNCCGEVQASFKELYPNLPATLVPSCGSIHCGYTVVTNKALQYTLIYHGFAFLWTSQYIIAFGVLTIAHAAVSYFNHVGAGQDLPAWPVARGMKNCFRYYAGSIAAGSLLVALVQAARVALAYIQEKTKKLQETNKLMKYLMMCLDCYLACVQKIVEMVNKSAYILIAMDGKSFFPSALQAVKLLVANAARISTVNIISDAVLFLGKVMVALFCAFFCFVYLDKYAAAGTVSSPIVPVILVGCTSFVFACIFFSVVEMCIETVIIAFCDDCDKNGGVPKYSPQALMDAMGVHKQMAEDLAKRGHPVARHCCGGGGAAEKGNEAGGKLPATDVAA